MKAIDKATKYELKELNKQFDFLCKNYIIDWIDNNKEPKKTNLYNCKIQSKDWVHEQTFDLNNIDDLRMYYFYCSNIIINLCKHPIKYCNLNRSKERKLLNFCKVNDR